MFNIGDIVFVRNTKKSLYQFLDTDPRFISYGVINNFYDGMYEIKNKNGEIINVTENETTKLIGFDEYIKRCLDISYSLKCNSEIAEEIKKEIKGK